MLWILDGHAITKIPLSDLDLEATRKENPRRGGRFLLADFPRAPIAADAEPI